MTHYLAFDLGASSSRAILGTLQDGIMRLAEVHRFVTPIVEDGEHLFWDLDVIWQELQAGLRQALDHVPALRSLSVDSWAVDYVPLDTSGNALRNPYCYRDPRTTGIMDEVLERMHEGWLYEITGIQFLPFNTLYQLLADQRDHPEMLRVAHQHLTMADYFNYRFSGSAVIDASMASTTQMMDVRTNTWSSVLMEVFRLDPAQWPVIVEPGTLLGPVQQADGVMAVASCSHDTGSAVAATPASDDSGTWAFLSCGTWSLLGMEQAEPLVSQAAREAGFTNEVGIDGTIRFLKNLTGLWALQECAREWGEADWSTIEAEARAASPQDSFIDLADARFLARGDMESRLYTYLREHDQPIPQSRGALVRLLLESIAESYRRALDDLQRVTETRPDTIHLFGGGSQNSLLCQMTADACGIPVVAGPVEATALGNLLIQARTMGDLPEGDSIREVAVRSSTLRTFIPDS